MDTRKKPGQRHDATGRSTGTPPYMMLHHYMVDCDAWQAISHTAQSLLLQIMRRHNGFNNGKIGLGEREAGETINRERRTARKAFRELMDKGFLRCTKQGAFSVKDRQASEWELTCFALPGEHTPKAWFRHWKPGTIIDPDTGEAVPASAIDPRHEAA